MNLFCRRIPGRVTSGSALAAWIAALVTTTALARTIGFWGDLLASPRFGTGLFWYSVPFVCVGVVLVCLGRWTPGSSTGAAVRVVSMGGCILALGVAATLLVAVCLNFDFKLGS